MRTNYCTIVDSVFPKESIITDAILVLGFSIFTAACAQIAFWNGPVPVTGQTLAVLMTGALLGSRRGALSMAVYLFLGASGMPYWFAWGGSPGFARLIGPTGGYLFGFILMAYVVGLLAERGWDRNVARAAAAMAAGSLVMYFCGLCWLAGFVPEGKVLELGLYPFIAGDIVKVALAGLLMPSGWRLLGYFKKRQ